MIDTIEVKDNITNTIALLSDMDTELDGAQVAINDITTLLGTQLWTGEAKTKCVQIHGLLEEYYSTVRAMADQLEVEFLSLRDNKDYFTYSSESIKILNTI